MKTEYGDLLCNSLYSIRMQESTEQRKLQIRKLLTQCKKANKNYDRLVCKTCGTWCLVDIGVSVLKKLINKR